MHARLPHVPQEWIPDGVWLNVVALSAMDAFRDIPDAVQRSDAAWRAWCVSCPFWQQCCFGCMLLQPMLAQAALVMLMAGGLQCCAYTAMQALAELVILSLLLCMCEVVAGGNHNISQCKERVWWSPCVLYMQVRRGGSRARACAGIRGAAVQI